MEENASQQQEQPVEQVTKTPAIEPSAPAKPRQKDPKKVAAGKALARKNKEAREAAAKLKESEESSPKDTKAALLSYDNVLKASALVGAGFTLYHGWSVVSGELKKRDAGWSSVTDQLKKRFASETAKKSPPPVDEPVEITPHTPKPNGIDME